MKKKDISPFERDTFERIKEDPEFAKVYFEELSERPIGVQIGILRRLRGISQERVAAKLKVKQSFISKLEKEGSDHYISSYEKLAQLLHAKLALVPIEK